MLSFSFGVLVLLSVLCVNACFGFCCCCSLVLFCCCFIPCCFWFSFGFRKFVLVVVFCFVPCVWSVSVFFRRRRVNAGGAGARGRPSVAALYRYPYVPHPRGTNGTTTRRQGANGGGCSAPVPRRATLACVFVVCVLLLPFFDLSLVSSSFLFFCFSFRCSVHPLIHRHRHPSLPPPQKLLITCRVVVQGCRFSRALEDSGGFSGESVFMFSETDHVDSCGLLRISPRIRFYPLADSSGF